MANWKAKIATAMLEAKDAGPILASTLTDSEAEREFDAGYGSREGDSFTAWTETRVYFPVVYDGAEWVGSVPRHPCDEKTYHHGGQ